MPLTVVYLLVKLTSFICFYVCVFFKGQLLVLWPYCPVEHVRTCDYGNRVN